MANSITITELFDYHKDRLGLKWVAGKKGEHKALDKISGDNKFSNPMLIGHMNFVHPNRIQVIGEAELEYLTRQGKAHTSKSIAKIFQNKPDAIFVAREIDIPEEFIKNAEATSTPLISSSINDQEIINYILYYLNNVLAETITIHGVFMAVSGIGVLLTGESGIGKSELALELLSRGHRLIADDAVVLSRPGPDTIVGSCPPALQDFLEVRGLGVLSIRSIFGDSAIKPSKNLRLIVELKPLSEIDNSKLDRLKTKSEYKEILGVKVPKVIIPVAPGRNLAVIIESASRNQILLDKGYDATAAFIKQQKQIMEQDSS